MDDDDLPPCVGEAYRDALDDIRRTLIDPNYQDTQ